MGIRQLALLSAFLLTDGGMSSKGKNWLIYFRNKDPKIIKYFQETLKGVTGKLGYVSDRKDGTQFIRTVDNYSAKKLSDFPLPIEQRLATSFRSANT